MNGFACFDPSSATWAALAEGFHGAKTRSRLSTWPFARMSSPACRSRSVTYGRDGFASPMRLPGAGYSYPLGFWESTALKVSLLVYLDAFGYDHSLSCSKNFIFRTAWQLTSLVTLTLAGSGPQRPAAVDIRVRGLKLESCLHLTYIHSAAVYDKDNWLVPKCKKVARVLLGVGPNLRDSGHEALRHTNGDSKAIAAVRSTRRSLKQSYKHVNKASIFPFICTLKLRGTLCQRRLSVSAFHSFWLYMTTRFACDVVYALAWTPRRRVCTGLPVHSGSMSDGLWIACGDSCASPDRSPWLMYSYVFCFYPQSVA